MSQAARKMTSRGVGGRSRAIDVDRYVSLRIRQRRIMLGLTQQQMAELIGVTEKQVQRYEHGLTRIAAGRLYQIARALGVEISYLFEDVDPERRGATRDEELMPQQRMLQELARDFVATKSRERRAVLCHLARVAGDESKYDDKAWRSALLTYALHGLQTGPDAQRSNADFEKVAENFEGTVYIATDSKELLEQLSNSAKGFVEYLGYEVS